MKRKVYLDGEMAQKFGSEFIIQAKNTADIFRNLECNFPDLRHYLIDCHEKDIGFIIKIGGQQVEEEEELLLSLGEEDVYISPQPAGSKGVGKILAAIAIVALVIYAPQLMLAAANAGGVAGSIGMSVAGFAMAASPYLIGIAVNLALTGIQEIMAPDPSVDDFNNDRETSYLFQGAEQSIVESDPVPVVYGQLRVPGRPIGFEIRNKDGVFSNGWSNGGVRGAGPDWQFIKGYNYVSR
jgi:predicted phage tail protein